MKNVPENELLSAYLDGEVTAEEQAHAERLLAASPAARQLLEELRALSTTLQGMPQYELGEDISEQVLRDAERRILTDSRLPAQPVGTLRQPVLRRLLNARTLFWPAAALAVALLLMLFGPQRAERPDVAHAPGGAAEEDAKEVEDEVEEVPAKVDAVGDAVTRVPAVEAIADETNGRGIRGREKRDTLEFRPKPAPISVVMDAADADSSGVSKARSSPSSRSASSLSNRPATPEEALIHKGRGSQPRPSEPKLSALSVARQSGTAPAAPLRPPAGPGKGRYEYENAGKSPKSGLGGTPTGKLAGKAAGRPDVQRGPALQAKPGNGKGGSDAGGTTRHTIIDGQVTAGVAQKLKTAAREKIACGFVMVELSADAAQKGVFDKLLPANKIGWDDNRDNARDYYAYALGTNSDLAESASAMTFFRKLARARHSQEEPNRPLDPSSGAKAPDETSKSTSILAKLAEVEGPVELVLVKATVDQLEAMLGDLNRQPEVFVSLEVAPARGVEQQLGWTRYSRRGGGQTGLGRAKTEDGAVQVPQGPRLPEEAPADDAKPGHGLQTADQKEAADLWGQAWRFSMPVKELRLQIEEGFGSFGLAGMEKMEQTVEEIAPSQGAIQTPKDSRPATQPQEPAADTPAAQVATPAAQVATPAAPAATPAATPAAPAVQAGQREQSDGLDGQVLDQPARASRITGDRSQDEPARGGVDFSQQFHSQRPKSAEAQSPAEAANQGQQVPGGEQSSQGTVDRDRPTPIGGGRAGQARDNMFGMSGAGNRRHAEQSAREEPPQFVLFVLRVQPQATSAAAAGRVTSENAAAEPAAPNAEPEAEQ